MTPEICTHGLAEEPVSPHDKSMKDEKEKIKKKERCHTCNKKLKMIRFACKCEHLFCVNHLNPHSHKCSYDYKTLKSNEIMANNPKLGDKLVKI